MPTVNKPFGLADPQYDALRVFSNQALEAGPGDGTAAGGGLENKIYLWPTDGSTITTYDPDQAGLIAALAAAVSGDTVWIPSMTIALTVGITVPTGATLRGMSRQSSVLSFTGNITAITLSAGARLRDMKVTVSGIGVVGVDMTADSTWMDCVDVEVASGTGVITGSPPIAVEAWAMYAKFGLGHAIAWTSDFVFTDASNAATWHSVASWPGGFDPTFFAMRSDATDFMVADLYDIYICTNVAAIRANPATTPSYTRILTPGDALANGETAESVKSLVSWRDLYIAIVRCTTSGNAAYGVYESGAWTWFITGVGLSTGPVPGTYNQFSRDSGVAVDYITSWDSAGSEISSLHTTFGGAGGQHSWRAYTSPTGTIYIVWRRHYTSNTTHIANASDGTSLYNLGVDRDFLIGGAYYGPQVYCVDTSGVLYASADGINFSVGDTFSAGLALNTAYTGGSGVIWFGNIISAGPVVKLSLTGGAAGSFVDKSGDLISAIGSSHITLVGAQLIF